MPASSHSSGQEEVRGNSPGSDYSRRRLRMGITLVSVAALLGLLVFYAPRHVARYLLSTELDELGITYEGIDTLDINPWSRELELGPVSFGAGPSERGQFGELDLSLRFNALLQRRVSLERLSMRGIDVHVTRSNDNRIALNGIPLEQFLSTTDASGQPEGKGHAWGAGIDTIELRDSRLIFQDREDGDLEVEVERLVMTQFKTWEPERPGRFELSARVNDIHLNWSGEARPFADNITLAINSRTRDADVPKVVRFTGPWGLDRREGSYDAELKYEVTLFDSGRLQGRTVGSIDIKGVDYDREGVFSLAFERAKVDLDVSYGLSESGNFTLKGEVSTDLDGMSGKLVDQTRIAATAGRIVMRGLDTEFVNNGRLRIDVHPDIDLEGVAFSGPIEISFDRLLEFLALLQSLSAGVPVSAADTGLGDYTGESILVPNSDVKLSRLRSQGDAWSLHSEEGRVELGLKSSSDLSDIQIVANERHINIERLHSVLERLQVTSGLGRLAVNIAGSNSLVAGAAKGPLGEFTIAGLATRMGRLDLHTQTGEISMRVEASGKAEGFSSRLYAVEDLPDVQLNLKAANLALKQASLDAKGGVLSWKAAGNAEVESLVADFGKGEQGAFKFNHARLDGLQSNESLQVMAEALKIHGVDVYLQRSLLEALIRYGEESTENSESQVHPQVEANLTKPAATAQSKARKVDVARLQTLLTELGYQPGPVDGLMGRRTAAAIRAFQKQHAMFVDGRPTLRLLTALESRAAGPVERDTKPASQMDAARPANPSLRVGRIALTGSPVLRFRDDKVTPQVTVDAVFKQAEVQNLDTQKTDQQTRLNLVADVNEHTRVELAGWVAGLEESSDMDIRAKVDNLELAAYSPYVVEMGGVHLDSGQLDTLAAATARQGAVQGEIQLVLDNMAFHPVSDEDAKRLSGTVGMPLETAVNLLKDAEGRIDLKLPVGGTLNKPEVDISSAVSKAIGGVLLNVFPPTMVASMLEGASKGGGPSFEPIGFAPGSKELDAAGISNADDVAQLLAEHPGLSLKVCGRSTAQDMEHFMSQAAPVRLPASGVKARPGQSEARPAQESDQAGQNMQELAIERMRAVRRYLIKTKGINAKRVPECRSIYETAGQYGPRVEILL